MRTLDPTRWLEDHGDYLYRLARRQLRSDALAEDAVQETLLSALTARERYGGDASPRTWLAGILKHKVVDLIRRQVREVELPCDDDGADDIDALFKADGHWAQPVAEWPTPEKDAERAQLRQVLIRCADGLKPAMARVFALRDVVGLDTDEICKELAISATNCWVLLHRARLLMRACLELNGFSGRVR